MPYGSRVNAFDTSLIYKPSIWELWEGTLAGRRVVRPMFIAPIPQNPAGFAGGTHPPLRRRAPIEQLPKWLLCIPLVLHWFALAARHRSLTLPSAANPAIPTGGLAGEGKMDCLRLIRPEHAAFVTPTAVVGAGEPIGAARRRAGFAFPLIAKPDIGWCGHGVQRIEDEAGLRAYQAAMPPGATILLQPLIPGPFEAGLQYIHAPGDSVPRMAVTLRHPPSVQGDGIRTLAALARADPRWPGASIPPGAARVPAAGEVVVLTTVHSLRVGARYEDAAELLTPALRDRVHKIAEGMGAFHAGRFDVRFGSIEALQAGQFTIIEVNGAGAEAIGAWDPVLGLRAAFGRVFANHRALFAVGAAMRARGHRPVGPVRLSGAWLRQMRLSRGYPPSN